MRILVFDELNSKRHVKVLMIHFLAFLQRGLESPTDFGGLCTIMVNCNWTIRDKNFSVQTNMDNAIAVVWGIWYSEEKGHDLDETEVCAVGFVS